MRKGHMLSRGTGIFRRNLREFPRNLHRAVFRHGPTVSDRARSQAVFTNFFLHIQPTRTHVNSLRLTYTWGLGVASFALFVILTATGILLMVYYKPATDQAYDSIKDLHYVVPTGRFIRNIHRWAAHLMVITVILHMARVFYTASYKAPREFNWVLGMVLFVLTLALSFTGYLLPWDQLAFWAITIGANIAASPRELTDELGITQHFDLGGLQKEILLGASEVGQEALIRFYVLHVAVLPLLMAVIIGVHFWRLRKDGGLSRPGALSTLAGKGVTDPVPRAAAAMPSKSFGLMCVVRGKTPATDASVEDTVPTWPYLLRAELLVFMATMAACVALGLLFDAPLKEVANPSVPENPAKAPWYFLGLQEMVSYSAFMGGVVIPTVVVVGLALIPFIDREGEEPGIWFSGPLGKRVAALSLLVGSVFAVLAVAVPVRFGWLRSWIPEISQLVIIFVNPGTILTALYAVWSLLVLKRTQSTRLAAIALFTCFLVGFVILTYVGTNLRGPNWDFYWSPSDWPLPH
jgi:quinol-cytochrome oxidoreductase complex cytochrome b subunit